MMDVFSRIACTGTTLHPPIPDRRNWVRAIFANEEQT